MNFNEILSEKSLLIDEILEKCFSGNVENLHNAIKYHMDTGGKRIRPSISIACAELMGVDKEKIIPFAASCEVLHNWFLVHDDIEDGDEIRRDKPTVWKAFGIPHAINVGDYMSEKVYETILMSRDRGVPDSVILDIIDSVVKTNEETAIGQTLEINMREKDDVNEEEYMKMVTKKTAYYLTLPIIGAMIIAGKNKEEIDAVIKYGMLVGPAFQIIDDVLDMTLGKGRGEIGRDVKEGKKSILIIKCLEVCSEEDRNELISILNKPVNETTNEDVQRVLEVFNKNNVIENSKEKAYDMITKAKQIEGMPEELIEILKYFADYMVKREN